MLNSLRVHGFRTLCNTTIDFSPLTIMIGKNGVGKTTILDVVQLLGKFARAGAARAFGPPPWSLGWQKTKGMGQIKTVDFELRVTTPAGASYTFLLRVDERDSRVKVQEERLIRTNDNTPIASFDRHSPPASGTILRPTIPSPFAEEIQAVSSIIQSFDSYELNPSAIERGNDPKHTYVSRDGFGVAAFLAHLKDDDPDRFRKLESRLKRMRPETQSIEVWAPSNEVFWGLRDQGQKYPFSAVHLSWGDRELVGLLCILYGAKPSSTIAIEEIDRGFHPSRYAQVIDLISEAAYDGLTTGHKVQVIVTTHSPSFVNKLDDCSKDIRLVTRSVGGGTVVRPVRDVLIERLGTPDPERPLGEVWEMGVLEETIQEVLN